MPKALDGFNAPSTERRDNRMVGAMAEAGICIEA